MNNKWSSRPAAPQAHGEGQLVRRVRLAQAAALVLLACATQTSVAAAPDWLRAQVGAPLPAHDETTNAIMLYSDTVLTVLPNGTMRRRQ